MSRAIDAGVAPPAHTLTEDDAHEIATEAYIYAFPIVLMDVTRRVSTNVPTSEPNGKAPVNRFAHRNEFPDASFTDVVRANADTLYSTLWFDVSAEPIVIQVPDSERRYHLLPILDMWTDVFACPGSRTTGDVAQEFAIVGPRWQGALPAGVSEVRAPTSQGWMIGRTQTNGKADYQAVRGFQAGLKAVPLSRYHNAYLPRAIEVDPQTDMSAPLEQVQRMDAGTFFTRFAKLTRLNPPHFNDQAVLARMRRIGLEPGRLFEISKVSPLMQTALRAAPALGLQQIISHANRSSRVVNGWEIPGSPIGAYGTDYLHRAEIAYFGLGANPPEDAIYPTMRYGTDRKPLQSDLRYVLRFEKGATPPVRAFWSITMYNEKQFFAENGIERYAIGDRDALEFNADGSLEIYIQRDGPGAENQSNWLPAPASGGFTLTMRLYWPRREAVDGRWKPPALKAVAS